MMKLLGAVMILVGCGGVGFSFAAAFRYQEQSFHQLIRALEHMECELRFQMLPLPELCHSASKVCTGCVKNVLRCLGQRLEEQIDPNAADCMEEAIKQTSIPERLRKCLHQLGVSLGRFDLAGQVQGLQSVKKQAEFELGRLQQNQDVRIRGYQTLGFCAGAALVVMFL